MPAAQRPVLRILTMPPATTQATEPCAGGYRCTCARCDLERVQSIQRGSRDTVQPWDAGQRRKAA